tara:strand:+ start:4569 stop:4703 length:135 start_codon:yes stop_codon:yes gene_type:complete
VEGIEVVERDGGPGKPERVVVVEQMWDSAFGRCFSNLKGRRRLL